MDCEKWPNDFMFMQRVHYWYVNKEFYTKKTKRIREYAPDGRSEHQLFNLFIVVALVLVFIFNNTYFAYSSIFMYTINLFLETICFLYVAKYFEYEGLQKIAMLMQLAFFHLSHLLIKNVLGCFGAEVDDYCSLSIPEIKKKTFINLVYTNLTNERAKEKEYINNMKRGALVIKKPEKVSKPKSNPKFDGIKWSELPYDFKMMT